MDRKVAFGGPQGYAARVLETFQTVSGRSSRNSILLSTWLIRAKEKEPRLLPFPLPSLDIPIKRRLANP